MIEDRKELEGQLEQRAAAGLSNCMLGCASTEAHARPLDGVEELAISQCREMAHVGGRGGVERFGAEVGGRTYTAPDMFARSSGYGCA